MLLENVYLKLLILNCCHSSIIYKISFVMATPGEYGGEKSKIDINLMLPDLLTNAAPTAVIAMLQ